MRPFSTSVRALRRYLVVLAAVLLAGFAVACGGDDKRVALLGLDRHHERLLLGGPGVAAGGGLLAV